MEAFLIKERYKITHVICARENYAALEAVDIQSREKDTFLLNVYEGDYLKEYLRCFDRLKFCPQYRGMFISDESLVAVFDFRKGLMIDRVFFKGAELDWRFRLKVAGELFHQALAMSDYPPQIACTAFLSENLQVFPQEERLDVNFMVLPMEGLCEREMLFLLTDQIKKILIKRWSSPKQERAFVAELAAGAETSAVSLYSRWTQAEAEIRKAYESIEGKGALGRALYLFFMNLSCLFGGKKKRGRG